MNADNMLMRLTMFAQTSAVLVAVPLSPDTGGGYRLLPITAVHHHDLAPEVVDHERAVEIFTGPWDESATETPQVTATLADICKRLALHHDDAHVRVGIPNGDHHRMMAVEMVGFAGDGVLVAGKMPVQLIVEPWDGPSHVIRMRSAA